MTAPDPFDLLCERCGYDLRGMGVDSPCPECGTPVTRSVPSARPGSLWQRAPSVRSYIKTSVLMVACARRVFTEVRLDTPGVRMSLALAIEISGGISFVGTTVISMVFQLAPGGSGGFLSSLTTALAAGLFIGAMTALASGILAEVLRPAAGAFARWRGYRGSPLCDGVVASHAAMVVPGVVLAWWCALFVAVFLDVGSSRSGGSLAMDIGATIAELVVGLLPFGAPVYVVWLTLYGRHLNRFANRPGTEHSLAD